MKIKKVKRKSMLIRHSGRSSDYISPSFGYGCLYKCAYCYMRRHLKDGVTIAINTEQILSVIETHAKSLGKKIPNQTSDQYWTYDISCNEDFALHAKHHKWQRIFQFFVELENGMATLATKYVNPLLLEFNPQQKVRIRFSLMPQILSDILEPNTSSIEERMQAIDTFIEAGYDVHVNFSPIIVNPYYSKLYVQLFEKMNDIIKHKDQVKAECIFLTHNAKMHEYNLSQGLHDVEHILWRPNRQEEKTSSYGGVNIRYQYKLKAEYKKYFLSLMAKHIDWCKVRYIF